MEKKVIKETTKTPLSKKFKNGILATAVWALIAWAPSCNNNDSDGNDKELDKKENVMPIQSHPQTDVATFPWEKTSWPNIEQEQLANQKFDEIFNKIYGTSSLQELGEGNVYEIQKNWNIPWILYAFNNPNTWFQKIIIQWLWEGDNNSGYILIRQYWKYKLETYTNGCNGGPEVDNLTPEELLNDILPNFEKRLKEWKLVEVHQRQRTIEDANQYAYQYQQDANRLHQENGLA